MGCRTAMQQQLLLALAVVVMSLTLTAPQAAAQGPRSFRDHFPPFPKIISAKTPNRGKWERMGRDMWSFLTTIDFDFVDSNGDTVPQGMPGSKIMFPVACGRIARLWIRMPFHDCGTYSSNRKRGGCNGSLRKEMPGTDPLIDLKTGKVLFEDTFDQLGADKARADYAFDPSRKENTGFANSVAFFYKMKFAAEKYGLKASWADIMIYGGLLSVVMCDGPPILFVPGRTDSKQADPAGLLPAPTDSGDVIMGAFQRMGLGSLDAVATLASHSTACFTAGCLDPTPSRLDTAWALDLLDGVPPNMVCNLPGKFPSDAKPRCYAPMDIELLKMSDTYSHLRFLTLNMQSPEELSYMIGRESGPYGYGSGVFWKVNMCGPGLCRSDHWSFFHLFATSYYRLCGLGLPTRWKGYTQEYTGSSNMPRSASAANATAEPMGGAAAAADGSEFAPSTESEQQRNATIKAWDEAYTWEKL